MLIAEAQLLSRREQKSCLPNPWQLHTLVNWTVWGKGCPRLHIVPSGLASRLPQAGSNGQETNQVESGTLRPSLGLKVIVPF